MKRCALICVIAASALLRPGVTWAQDVTSGNITGVARDASGAVLPGVTVEAASPALIEKVRTVVTDGSGRYRVVDLRPGTYTVTFSLAGFRSVRREGIEVTTGFSATVNADLSVGALEETITITGAAPVVDVHGTVQQQVFTGDTLKALPMGKNAGATATLLPGAYPNTLAAQDVGGMKGEQAQQFTIHDADVSVQMRDGMVYAIPQGTGNLYSAINPQFSQEVVVQMVGGLTAEAIGSGLQLNFVPKDGGNTFKGSFLTDFGHRRLQGNNINDALRVRGATVPATIRKLYDVTGAFGGPIRQNKLWFFGSARYLKTSAFVPGIYFNQPQLAGTLFYAPDLSRPAYELSWFSEQSLRVTWQASARNKVTLTGRIEPGCTCYNGILSGTRAPETVSDIHSWPFVAVQGGWTRPATNRLLLEVQTLILNGTARYTRPDAGNAYAVLDRTTNFWHGAPGLALAPASATGVQYWGTRNLNGSVSYVTGSHAVKAGAQFRISLLDGFANINHDVSYIFAGQTPQTVTYWATPYENNTKLTQFGLFAQDQWTTGKLTLNLGLRLDYANGHIPAQHLGAGAWVPARDFPEVSSVPNWKDLDPRLGVAYDLFGNGRTALKVAVGRFVPLLPNNGTIVTANNPVNAMVTSATRTWTDNGDYIPQANELGPISATDFGSLRVTTRYADEVLRGFDVRPYSWQGSASIQHQIRQGLGVNVAYFRTQYGNFMATDNLLVAPADYDQYCITEPANSQLPDGGGQRICGLLAISAAKFGKIDNLVTHASNFGKQKEIHNAVDFTVNARLPRNGLITGGASIGRTATDNCQILAALPEMAANASPQRVCHVSPPLLAGTQVKLSAVYPLPWDLRVSANYQNTAGIATTATYTATNAEIFPSLNRNLASGPAGTAAIELITPNSLYRENRITQLNFALNRIFRAGGSVVQPRVEFHNVLNANPILQLNQAYGNSWQSIRGLLAPRLIKFGVSVDF